MSFQNTPAYYNTVAVNAWAVFETAPAILLILELYYQGPMFWSQFSAIFDNFQRKNWRFYKKTNVMIKFLHNLALFWVRYANFFAEFFGKNI
jgi:hypothetical protein